MTGRPVTMESPRSPLTASARKIPYWTMTGLSSPMFSRTCCDLLLGRLLPQEHLRRVARDGAHHEEHHDGHPEQHRDDLQDPAPDVTPPEAWKPPACSQVAAPPTRRPKRTVLNASPPVGLAW